VNIVGLRDRLAIRAGREGGGRPHGKAADGKQNRGTGELRLPAQKSLLVHLNLLSPILLRSLDTAGWAYPVGPLNAP
jgi:hypothetical protein